MNIIKGMVVDMITLEKAKENIGNKVVYQGKEEGIIYSVNDKFVFVKYSGNCTAQATNPKDLEFLV